MKQVKIKSRLLGEQPAFFICGPVLFSSSTSPILLFYGNIRKQLHFNYSKHRKMFPGNLKLSAKCLFSSTKNYYRRKHACIKFSHQEDNVLIDYFFIFKKFSGPGGFWVFANNDRCPKGWRFHFC